MAASGKARHCHAFPAAVGWRAAPTLQGGTCTRFFAQVQSFPVKSSLDLTGLDRTWQVHSFRPSPALLAQVQVVLAQVQHFGPSPALSSQVQRFPPKSSTFQPSPALFSQVQHFRAKSSALGPNQSDITRPCDITKTRAAVIGISDFQGCFSTS